MRIHSFISLLALPLLAASFAASAQDAGIVGRWKTLDDKTGKPMTITEVYQARNGTFAAKIVENLGLPDTCTTCSGKNKGQPVVGMLTLWNLKPVDGGWGEGNGYKPSEDRSFKAKKVELIDGGKRLKVTGCVAAFICRSAEWVRVD